MFVEKVGISEMDTIVAATSNGAKVLRVYDKTGSLEAERAQTCLSSTAILLRTSVPSTWRTWKLS